MNVAFFVATVQALKNIDLFVNGAAKLFKIIFYGVALLIDIIFLYLLDKLWMLL